MFYSRLLWKRNTKHPQYIWDLKSYSWNKVFGFDQISSVTNHKLLHKKGVLQRPESPDINQNPINWL